MSVDPGASPRRPDDPSEHRFRSLALAVPVGVFETDADGHCVFVNHRWTDITQLSAEQALGEGWLSALHPDDRGFALREWFNSIADGREFRLHFRFRRPNGMARWVISSAIALREPNGEVTGYLGTVTDVTDSYMARSALRDREQELDLVAAERERERLVTALERTQRLDSLGRLAGGMAHDFNNLLGVILNYSAAMGRDPSLSDSVKMDIAQIEAAAKSGAHIARQLLRFSRPELGANAQPELCDLVGIARRAISLLERPLQPHVALALSSPDRRVMVTVHRSQIEQLLVNLILNARDASDAGAVVRVSVEERLPSAILTVTDTGVGMSAETLAQVFEPFFTTKERGTGTGLGLSLAHNVVEQAHGQINIESTPGDGTSVIVELPSAGPSSEA